jgi:predicted transcriptional regulator
MSINMEQKQPSVDRQMLHIRLPGELHRELRELAASRGEPLQRVAERALRDALAGATVPSEAGLTAAFRNRRDGRLAERLDELLAGGSRIDLAGLTLLDFLAEDGWGNQPLSAALGRGVPARLAIVDREAPATRARLATTYGFSVTDDAALRSCAKYVQLEYAEKLLDALAAGTEVEARRHSLAPSWRWLLRCGEAVLAEAHLPRLRTGCAVSTALMPVFEFDPGSPAAERLREHFETLWYSAG